MMRVGELTMGHQTSSIRLAFCSIPLLLSLLSVAGCSVGASGGSAAASSPAQAAANETATGMVSPLFFGMVVNGGGAVSVATGSRRIFDPGTTWAAVEPQRGVFAWGGLDAEVGEASAAGEEITLTLGMTPLWASSSPAVASTYGPGATAMPANLADWDVYVAAVAARYSGRVSAYEVWNTPDDPACWSGPTATMGSDMATLSAHATTLVHAADPDARVISPGFSPVGLQAFLSAGGGSAVDILGASLFPAGATPETAAATLGEFRNTLAGTTAAGKPVWSEGGPWVLPGSGTPGDLFARALVISAGYGVARVHWFSWDDALPGTLQLTDGSGQPTAVTAAYTAVETWLNGAYLNGCAATAAGLWTCQLQRGGAPAWIVWAASGTLSASTLGASTVTDLAGNSTSLAGNNVIVTGSPVLLQ